jgi:prenylcysteine oxidase/farnesylcysteine lyase
MKILKSLLIFFTISTCLSERVAIIGAGIGGASAAHYLLKNNNIKVDLFEKDGNVGGRVQSKEFNGQMINVGASFFIKDNKLIYDLIKELGVEINSTENLKSKQQTSIVSGHDILVNLSNNKYINIIKFLWRYGLSPLYVKFLIDGHVKQFVKIYDMLESGRTFDTLADFIKAIGLPQLTNYTIEEYLLKNGIDQLYIDEVVNAFVHGIYNQDKTINAFAGFITLAGSGNETFEITKGNNYLIQAVADKLAPNANFKLYLNTKIDTIRKDNKKFYIGDTEYDRVILASPLEKTGIKFQNITINNTLPHYFKDTHVTVVEGSVNPAYFKNSTVTPNTFISNNKNITENVSDLIYRADNMSTIQGDNGVPDLGFPILNEGYTVLYRKYWDFGYPDFKKYSIDELPSFTLDKGLYYINGIETAGSCQELSMIAARNIVNIIEKELGLFKNSNSTKKATEDI